MWGNRAGGAGGSEGLIAPPLFKRNQSKDVYHISSYKTLPQIIPAF